MSNDQNGQYHIEALYTVAEDIYRFAPWESGYAPFFLIDPVHPDAYVLVVFESDGEGVCDLRLILGLTGLRAWLMEQMEEDVEGAPFSAEEFVNHYEGYYLEVGYNMPNLNNYEKRLLEDRQHSITFRRQRPGYGLATIIDGRDFAHLERYLRAILQLLTRRMLGDITNAAYHLQPHNTKHLLTAAAFSLIDGVPAASDPFALSREDWLTKGDGIIDEFSNARVKHLPSSGQMMELYYFYLPVMAGEKGQLPRAYFLADLETGLIVWNEVVLPDDEGTESLLRQLWDHFLEEGQRPERILIQNVNTYSQLAADLKAAGIFCEYIPHSYVGQELLEGYLQATHLRQHQMLDDQFPRDPY